MRHRPEILIGVYHVPAAWISEVMYGIEEEGGLFAYYEMEDEKDIRFSLAGVTVTLSLEQAALWDHTVRDRQKIYTADSQTDPYRKLGMNSVRYLKGKKFLLT